MAYYAPTISRDMLERHLAKITHVNLKFLYPSVMKHCDDEQFVMLLCGHVTEKKHAAITNFGKKIKDKTQAVASMYARLCDLASKQVPPFLCSLIEDVPAVAEDIFEQLRTSTLRCRLYLQFYLAHSSCPELPHTQTFLYKDITDASSPLAQPYYLPAYVFLVMAVRFWYNIDFLQRLTAAERIDIELAEILHTEPHLNHIPQYYNLLHTILPECVNYMVQYGFGCADATRALFFVQTKQHPVENYYYKKIDDELWSAQTKFMKRFVYQLI
ncbi:ORF6 [Ranid herpesvirus 2]|uniref:ORF6 n=1 Tax=Ranid herpesvirus 2 TaxID=389214 RepID=Q14WA0_9VIRU|nr:ORF6 [Ranid herpesvirus 2]ABG25563.1 ORF6 [Ranid herpesvirus 2]